jgi:hypothetical protein
MVDKKWDDVDVVGVVLVRVTVRDERGWFVEVGVIGQCVVVCCDRAVDVEVKGSGWRVWVLVRGLWCCDVGDVVSMGAGVVLTMVPTRWSVVDVEVSA